MLTKYAQFLTVVLSLGACAAVSRADELNALLPEDTLAFVELSPQQPAAIGGRGGLLDLSIQGLSSFGVVPRETAVVADFLRLSSQLGQHRSCLAWLNADFVVNYDTGLLTTRSVELALILDVNGNAKPVVDQLTVVLRNFSTQQTARQTVRTTAEGRHSYVEFHDTRWPEWEKLYWAQVGGNFVITLGQGSMEHFFTGAAGGDSVTVPWTDVLNDADALAARQGNRGQILLRGYVHTAALRERWPDVMTMTVASRLLAVYQGQKNESAIMTARSQDRLVQMDAATVENGRMTLTPWTITPVPESVLAKMIPPEAQHYMVLSMNWPVVYERLVSSLDLLTGDKRPLADQVRLFPQLYGVNLERDILDQLAPQVLIHDAPQHPLHLPLMITGVASAKAGQESAVQNAMNKLISNAQRTLDERAGLVTADGTPVASSELNRDVRELIHPLIRTTPDGIMHVRYGLLGPAWCWQGRRLIFGWGPAAVRANMQIVKSSGE